MRSPSRTVVIAVVLALAGGAVVTLARQPTRTQPASAPATRTLSCPSPALGGVLPAVAYLPAGYGRGGARYPVVYFLHGLPAGPDGYRANAFIASALASGSRPAIVVAAQGARTADSDPEYLEWGPKENWPLAITRDLTHCVDSHLRTIANRTGRALIGLSAGGFGAFNIGLRNLATFGAVESWSGYFEATDPAGLHRLDLGSGQRNEMASVPRGQALKAALERNPTFIGFYVGAQDDRFVDDNAAFDQEFTGQGIMHLFRIYSGGHSPDLWHAQASPWLGYALSALASLR